MTEGREKNRRGERAGTSGREGGTEKRKSSLSAEQTCIRTLSRPSAAGFIGPAAPRLNSRSGAHQEIYRELQPVLGGLLLLLQLIAVEEKGEGGRCQETNRIRCWKKVWTSHPPTFDISPIFRPVCAPTSLSGLHWPAGCPSLANGIPHTARTSSSLLA